MTINRLIEILETAKAKIGGDKEITFWDRENVTKDLCIMSRYNKAGFNVNDLIAIDRSKMTMEISD